MVHIRDLTPTSASVANDVAEELIRCRHLYLHDGLEKNGTAPLHRFLDRQGPRHLEGQLGRVYRVMLPIHKLHTDVDDRISSFNAGLQRLADAVLDCRDELARHSAADDLVLERDAAAAFQRLDVKLDVRPSGARSVPRRRKHP